MEDYITVTKDSGDGATVTIPGDRMMYLMGGLTIALVVVGIILVLVNNTICHILGFIMGIGAGILGASTFKKYQGRCLTTADYTPLPQQQQQRQFGVTTGSYNRNPIVS